jgi:2-polyprenyl-3-methyl-5-hydroxy-6-metoxy-1,4-benzoquinol methylase
MPSTIPLDAPKSATYYGLARSETLEHLPKPVGRVLDVGCGEGGAAALLRDGGATWISGIELLPEPAAVARGVYDEVLVGDALEVAPRASGPFDTTLCYDVLEHLYDPLGLLRSLHELAAPGGRLHVSVPNASHISLLRDLILRGTFGYQPFGHRDATHIRWFTRRDIVALIGEAGWHVQSVAWSQLHRSRHLHTLTRGRTTEFLAGQWYVLARRDP